ncbi:Aspartic proteinase CDR1, partial [Mucuna pruriens]
MSLFSSLTLVFVCLYNISFLEALNNGFSVEMIHRDSSRSPFYRHTETQFQRVANAMRRSINRANSITAEANVTADQGEYLVSYSVGTPPFQHFGIVDTGSDIFWLQCLPCKTCYKQTTPIFDPSKSKTYQTLPCSSDTCQSLPPSSCTSNESICEYSINYRDGSHSQGNLSVETLTLGSTNGSFVQFPKIVIGCGHDNNVSFEGKSSGIVGLGRGPISIISQLSSSIGGKFSYCLTPMDSQSNSSSKLNFGDAAVVSGDGTVSTPIVPQGLRGYYYLTLEAFSVGEKRIGFESPSSRSSGVGNIIIDSGTTLTLLPYVVYSKLESAVANAVKLKRAKDPSQILSLCYQSTSDKLDAHVPVITAHFSGADVKLNAINTFIEVAHGIVCLAFQTSEIGSILGNMAQQNMLVGYDLQKKLISFKPTDCTKHLVPTMFSQSNISSKLNFGEAALVSGRGTVSTPIVPHFRQDLTLEAFNFGDSSSGYGGKGNIIIDSGTTLTLLPYDDYSKLESVVSGEDVKLNAINTFIQVAMTSKRN